MVPVRAPGDNPGRVIKTLVCLVGAMTGTTTLLGWMNPSQSFPPEELTSGDLIHVARSVVDDDVRIDAGLWEEVEVLTSIDPGAMGPFLAAHADRGDYHFYIDGNGRPVRTGRWRRQQPSPLRPNAIRIEVASRGDSLLLTSAQLRCLRAIVAVLSESLGYAGAELPVRWGQDGRKDHGLDRAAFVRIGANQTIGG